MKDHITIEGHNGTFAAYIARPKTLPARSNTSYHLHPHCERIRPNLIMTTSWVTMGILMSKQGQSHILS